MKSYKSEPIKGWHHFYTGIGLVFISFYLIWVNVWVSAIVGIMGLVILGDDYYQHIRQQAQPLYRSPLRRLYSKWLYPMPWVQKITQLFDRIFGK